MTVQLTLTSSSLGVVGAIGNVSEANAIEFVEDYLLAGGASTTEVSSLTSEQKVVKFLSSIINQARGQVHRYKEIEAIKLANTSVISWD